MKNQRANETQAKRSRMYQRLAALAVAGVFTFGGAMSAEAAGLKDVFDAQYYADQYEDLKQAFGYNKTQLQKHYNQYGKAEGRTASALIDVQAYKAAYPDLQAAFGNNLDAYVQHYIQYGYAEGRNSFGTFDARAYAERYPDLQAAFGNDVLALYKHYINNGRAEGRDASSGTTEQTSQTEEFVAPNFVAPNFVPQNNYVPDNYVPAGDSSDEEQTPSDDNTQTPSDDNTQAAPIATMGQLINPETNAPVANATITFTRNANGARTVRAVAAQAGEVVQGDGYYQVTTDENGFYTVPEFEPGDYAVEAQAEGYLSLTLNSITIAADNGSFTLPTFQMLSADISGTNTVSGTAINATTGQGIAGAVLNIRSDWNNQTGDVINTLTADEDGNYSVELERGYYTIEFVMEGFSPVYVNVASSNAVGVCSGVLNPNAGDSTIDEVQSTEFRIVLTWGQTPRDLDSHLVGLNGNDVFHVYFGDKVETDADGNVIASLDVDDTSSYGPETVTIVDADVNSTYYYSVHDFTNRNNETSMGMSMSGANVKVYQGSQLAKEYNVPLNQAGYVWNVFKIENGVIVDINDYNSEYSSMYGEYGYNSYY